MATTLMPYSNPNAGAYTTTGDFLTAISAVGGDYVSSSESTGQFFVSVGDIPATDPVNSVTIRVVARLAAPGTRDMTTAVHNGGISYHPTNYNLTNTDWQTFEWVWETSPWTGLAWTPAEINTIGRSYVRTPVTGGTTDTQVDFFEIEVDHGTEGGGAEYTDDFADPLVITDSVEATLTSGPADASRTYPEAVEISDSIQATLEGPAPEQVLSLPLNAIGSAGAFTTTAPSMLDALIAEDGVYASSGITSTQFYGTYDEPTVVGNIHWVKVKAVARLAEAGARVLNAALHQVTTLYHPTNYAVNSTDWETFEWQWDLNPATGTAWTTQGILDLTGRVYVRTPITGGTTDLQVDHVLLEVGYDVTAQNPSRTIPDTLGITDSIQATLDVGGTEVVRNISDAISVTDITDPQELEVVDNYTDAVSASDSIEATLVTGFTRKIPGVTSVRFGEIEVSRIYLGSIRIW